MKLKKQYPLLFSVLLALGNGQANAQKAQPEAPEEQYLQDSIKVEKILSNIAVPFDIALTDIERQINNSIAGLIYEDNSYTDNGNDHFKIKVWKQGDITITAATNDVFNYTVLLKVWAEKGYTLLGYTQYKSTTFEMKLKFSTKVSINTDWTMQTQTSPNGYEWVTKPAISFGSVVIPITSIVGKLIDNNHHSIARNIDESVAKNMSFRPYVVEAWNMVQKPYLVSEEYKTWLKASPIAIQMTPLRTVGKSLVSTVGFKAYTETVTGVQPVTPPKTNKIPTLQYVSSIPDDFQIAMMNNVSYPEATAIAKKMFVGQQYDFNNGRYQITVTNLDIYGSDNFLVIKTDVVGSLKGTIYIKGIPIYDVARGQIVLSQTQFDVKTKNILVKAAAWLLEGTLEKKIQQSFGLPVNELLEYAKTNVETALNAEYMKGVKMNGKINELLPDKVLLSPDGITAIVRAKGKVQLKVSGL